ncbi:MAG TPA: putative toxin-antitoxin system toxin component, PIN family [bacterium]|nr:putative toxin-antitoxin system toxin component, PIN family [bacterium]
MLRAVFDTNVFISALFGGFPEEAYRAVLERRCALVVSPSILAELARTLREKFHTPEAAIVVYVRQIGRIAEIVRPHHAVLRDQGDNRVLECAEAGQADLIVSGDRDLLRLKRYGAVPIVRPADFVRTLGPSRAT